MTNWSTRIEETGWLPIIGGMAYLILRPVVRALLPEGYYFRFMRRVLVPKVSVEETEQDVEEEPT